MDTIIDMDSGFYSEIVPAEAVPEREVNWLGVLVSVGERCSSGTRLGSTERDVGDAMHHPGVSGNLLVAIACS